MSVVSQPDISQLDTSQPMSVVSQLDVSQLGVRQTDVTQCTDTAGSLVIKQMKFGAGAKCE